jgi:hypothetical protein
MERVLMLTGRLEETPSVRASSAYAFGRWSP